eukprot:5435458-Prymnesium_polylepis.1
MHVHKARARPQPPTWNVQRQTLMLDIDASAPYRTTRRVHASPSGSAIMHQSTLLIRARLLRRRSSLLLEHRRATATRSPRALACSAAAGVGGPQH